MRYLSAFFLTTDVKNEKIPWGQTSWSARCQGRPGGLPPRPTSPLHLLTAAQLAVQPGACVVPVPVRRRRRYANGLPGLVDRHACEVAQLDELSRGWIVAGQPGQRVVDRQELVRRGGHRHIDGID